MIDKQYLMSTELLVALYHRNFPKVRDLLSELGDPDAKLDTFLHSAVHIAVILKDSDLLKFLVRSCGCQIDTGDVNGWSPLGYMAIEGDPENNWLARFLVRLGADVHYSTRESNYESPLDFAKDKQEDNAELYTYFRRIRDAPFLWERRRLALLARTRIGNVTLI